MVTINEIVEISEEVLKGDIFGIVKIYNVGDPAQPESSATRILSITYPTQPLCQALKAASERFLGQRRQGTFLFAGGYGTGKSHCLLAIYHLLTSLSERKQWMARWSFDVPLPEKTRVILLHLLDEDPDFLWEPVFRKAGREDLLIQVKDFPTISQIKAALSEEPTVIILDELESYYSAIGDRTRREQTLNFLQNLTEATTDSSMVLLVFVSIYGRNRDLLARFGREKVFLGDLGSSEDKVKVVLFRLFKRIEEEAAKRVVEEYMSAYSAQKEAIGDIIGSFDDYRVAMNRTFPLHPELVKLLFATYASSANYQNTRGILYLLSGAIKKVYNKKSLLLTADIDPECEEIHDDLFQLRADLLDRCVQDIHRNADEPLAKGILSTILLYSLAGEKAGCEPGQVVLGSLTPELNINEIDRVLGKVEAQSWYLWRAEGRYVLRAEENLPVSINSRAARWLKDEGSLKPRTKLAEIIKERLKPVKAYVHPIEQIPDTRQLKIVVSTKHLSDEEASKTIFHGREWRNTVILVRPKIVGDLAEGEDLLLRVLRLTVCEDMEKEVSKKKTTQLRELKQREKTELDSRISGAYGEWMKPVAGEKLFFRPIECSLDSQQILSKVRDSFGAEALDEAVTVELTDAKEKGRRYEDIRVTFLKQLGKPILIDLEGLKKRVLTLHGMGKVILERGKTLYGPQNPPPDMLDDMVLYLKDYVVARVPKTQVITTPETAVTVIPHVTGELPFTPKVPDSTEIAEPVKTITYETKEYATPFSLQTEVEGRLVIGDRVRKLTLFISGEGLQETSKIEQLAVDVGQGSLKIDLEMELQFPQWISKEQLLKLLDSLPVPLKGQVKAKIEMERSLI